MDHQDVHSVQLRLVVTENNMNADSNFLITEAFVRLERDAIVKFEIGEFATGDTSEYPARVKRLFVKGLFNKWLCVEYANGTIEHWHGYHFKVLYC